MSKQQNWDLYGRRAPSMLLPPMNMYTKNKVGNVMLLYHVTVYELGFFVR